VPRSCSICEHDDLKEINEALASNEWIRDIADRWSLSKTALMRHRNEHLPVSVIEAQDAEEAEEDVDADGLVDSVRDLQKNTLTILEEAEEAEELDAALRAIGEAKGNLERAVELLEEFDEHP
jgi:hypothetical protein